MITFVSSIVVLILGYVLYGVFVEKIFGIDSNRPTPAKQMADGVDYVELPAWRIFLIQFLNIAGLGPIFGAIMGVMFGPAAFLWIVFGSIFGGAVHDYLSGMLSMRFRGEGLPDLIGRQLGVPLKRLMSLFTVLLMVLVGAVFVSGPAGLLASLTPEHLDVIFWVVVILIYYFLAAMLPIDKLIGKIYPLFGAVLLFMAVGLLVAMFATNAPIPELTDGLYNRHPQQLPIFPMMFVSIACGAISGFHATQSPLMARCCTNERQGRAIFYGAMIAEGVVALIWAAAASSYFGSIDGLINFTSSLPANSNKAAEVVNVVSRGWLGKVGGVLAILGVIAAPITTGDTALRSARLIIADFFNINQKPIVKRLLIAIPIFAVTYFLLQVDFDIIWRYFALINQTLATITLIAVSVYLVKERNRFYWVAFLPALFMMAVCSCYLLVAPECFAFNITIGYWGAAMSVLLTLALFYYWKRSIMIIPEPVVVNVEDESV